MKKVYLLMIVILMMGVLMAGCGGNGIDVNDGTDFAHDDHDHEHGDIPYEWSGEYTFEEGEYTLDFAESGDPSCMIAFVVNEGDMDDIAHLAHHIMEAHMDDIQPGEHFTAMADYGYNLILNPEETTFTFEMESAGEYVIFLEHFPCEFDLKILDSSSQEMEGRNPVEYEDPHDHH